MKFADPSQTVKLLKRMSEIKADYLKGVLNKVEATKLVDALLHEFGLLKPGQVTEVDDIPGDFFLPCDCLIRKCERGESPLPLEAIVTIENLRMAFRMGLVGVYDAVMQIRPILRQYNVSDEEALRLWNVGTSHQSAVQTIAPLQGEEFDFFQRLEEQMKDKDDEERP